MAEKRTTEIGDGVVIAIEPDPCLDETTCICCRALPCRCPAAAREKAMKEAELQSVAQLARRYPAALLAAARRLWRRGS